LAAGAKLREIIFRDLAFDPDLHLGYRQRMELETDLLDAWKKIQLANLLVWVNPVCPGGQSAMTKGFVDRLFLPGFSFKYQEDSVWHDKLLAGKTGPIITTRDQPEWCYWLAFGQPSINQLKQSTVGFCGIQPVRTTNTKPPRKSTEAFPNTLVTKVEQFGRKLQ